MIRHWTKPSLCPSLSPPWLAVNQPFCVCIELLLQITIRFMLRLSLANCLTGCMCAEAVRKMLEYSADLQLFLLRTTSHSSLLLAQRSSCTLFSGSWGQKLANVIVKQCCECLLLYYTPSCVLFLMLVWGFQVGIMIHVTFTRKHLYTLLIFGFVFEYNWFEVTVQSAWATFKVEA